MASASSGRKRISWRARARSKTSVIAAALFGLLAHDVAGALSLSHQDAMRIGRKIWQNECGATTAGLTSWNDGENFASLGIGHFIWYPAGMRGPFEESFPTLIRCVEQRGAKLPRVLLGPDMAACPWRSRKEFLAAQSSTEMKQLRTFLADTIDLQTDFMVLRLREALPKMLAAAPPNERAAIEQQFDRVANSAQGCYALIDYVNFKGEGVLITERYRGRGWGLLQVLESMSGAGKNSAAVQQFADAAGSVLRERVANSPPERNEARWLRGWLSRIATYRKP